MSDIYGWTGQFLWVDLSTGKIKKMDTRPYTESYIGGRGIQARLAWDFMPAGIGAFDERNLLMIFPGPLSGTTAPFSGRTNIAGHAPQGWPYEWFSRANFGGHFGSTLKYAGYDGIVIAGKSEKPVYLYIADDKVELRDAAHLWGQGAIRAQKMLMSEWGPAIRILTMGQAGENLSRISVVQTETESAAGQGGYGAVMGDKKLKAIVVQGSGAVRVAQPDLLLRRSKAIVSETRQGCRLARGAELDPELLKKYPLRYQACTQQCGIKCGGWSWYFDGVPGPLSGEKISGHWHCVAPIFPGLKNTFYNWNLGFEAGFELGQISNDYGLNHWDLVFGVLPLVRYWKESGVKPDLDGLPIDLDNPHFWAELFRKMAYREGIGDALAEGGYRAALKLGLGLDLAEELYQGWGYAGHMDARGDRCNRAMYPFWIAPGLQWAIDTRDPMGGSHGYIVGPLGYSPFGHPDSAGPTWEQLMAGAEKLYGTRSAMDPLSNYEGKAEPAYWHCVRAAIKDSVTVDDNVFPMIWSYDQPDGMARADGMEGTAFEYHLFTAATGSTMSEGEFNRCGDRICNLERALQIRDNNRSRKDDEIFITHFANSEDFLVNPLVGKPMKGDPEKMARLMDQFYALRGWDVLTGRPRASTLLRLGLEDVAMDLKERKLI